MFISKTIPCYFLSNISHNYSIKSQYLSLPETPNINFTYKYYLNTTNRKSFAFQHPPNEKAKKYFLFPSYSAKNIHFLFILYTYFS